MAEHLPPGRDGVGPEVSTRRRALFLVHYLAVLVVAELLIVFAATTRTEWPALVGLLLEIFLVVSFPVLASFVVADRPLASFLGALILAPILRIVTLATPVMFLTPVQWLAVVSVPLLLAAGAIMQAQGLRPRDVFLAARVRPYAPLNVALVAIGVAIGFAEFQVIQPASLIAGPDSPELPFAVFAVFLTMGLTEELIFRGILLRTALPLLGRGGALAYVSGVYAILQIGFLSVPELLFAFVIGLVYGAVVLVTRSLWGAIGSHALANIVVYLVLPFAF